MQKKQLKTLSVDKLIDKRLKKNKVTHFYEYLRIKHLFYKTKTTYLKISYLEKDLPYNEGAAHSFPNTKTLDFSIIIVNLHPIKIENYRLDMVF